MTFKVKKENKANAFLMSALLENKAWYTFEIVGQLHLNENLQYAPQISKFCNQYETMKSFAMHILNYNKNKNCEHQPAFEFEVNVIFWKLTWMVKGHYKLI